MITALVVDDEKLARKGFISIVPWEQFEIEIIGEAVNGKIALEFMRQHQVDLIFIDLTMPVMNGIELMKAIREQFHQTRMVVLTCHQDFDYIQEALRLGALDYIVKTQLDTEKIEEIIGRILDRIEHESAGSYRKEKPGGQHFGLLVDVAAAGTPHQRAFPAEINRSEHVLDVSSGMWLFRKEHQEMDSVTRQYITSHENWLWADIEGASLESIQAISKAVHSEALKQIYYDFQPGQKFGFISLNIPALDETKHSNDWDKLYRNWREMNWIYEDEAFQAILIEIADLRPNRDTIKKLIDEHLALWFSVLSEDGFGDLLADKDGLYFWHQTSAWLTALREALRYRTGALPYSTDIIILVMKAIRLIHESSDYDFNRDELAAKFLMSGSYFSRCFKDIVGKPYSEYTKHLRLEKSVALIESTLLPIYTIAEKTGFQDEKYFSRVFFKQFGRNPLDHRKQFGKKSGRTL
ncbi:response regulator [Paenibacillus sp. BC26]|uniref:response regulator transcription factor n=1 Tax=Paenibacillus sp. BC26 TaxID=1881032 RepID=UPI0008E0091E|nr:response regulator [Paenibacillus sp. BC26]SFS48001.1 two-component system, response regulator YesN [Paenibacillus sp. BC26]